MGSQFGCKIGIRSFTGRIISDLDIKKPVYLDTATYIHFGKDLDTWERTDKVAELQKAFG
jgi:S-adenosylmethionine synthetase